MIRPLAKKMYDALMFDSLAMVSNACLVDFGLDACSPQEQSKRFGALQNAVRRDEGASLDDLDFAMGNSKRLTALVQKYGSDVEFPPTAWDQIEEEEEELDDYCGDEYNGIE